MAKNSSDRSEIRVTMMDVARAAGLSRAATSYALRDDPHVSEATRVRVRKIANSLGYRPDPLLSKLMSHLHEGAAKRYLGKLAFINPDPKKDYAKTATEMRSFFGSLAPRALALGYEVEEFWWHEPGRSPRQLARMLLARGIRGIIVGEMQTMGELTGFPWEHFSSITVGYSVVAPTLPRVVPHHYRNTTIALQQVQAAGYKRPGLLAYRQQSDAMSRLQVGSFLAWHAYSPGGGRADLVSDTGMNDKVIRQWFDAQRPDVILTTNQPANIFFSEAGIRFPRDVALVSLLQYGDAPQIAGVTAGYDRLGAMAVNQLVLRLQHDERGIPENIPTIELEGRWVDGPSMPRAR